MSEDVVGAFVPMKGVVNFEKKLECGNVCLFMVVAGGHVPRKYLLLLVGACEVVNS